MMRPRSTTRAVGIGFALLLLIVGPWRVAAERRGEGGRVPGFFRGLRERIAPTDAARAWQEARQLPAARDALPLMKSLVERNDPSVSPRAALWLGHFQYGAGDTETALGWFEKAADAGGDEAQRAEALFWEAQCLNLLGRAPIAAAPEGQSVPDVLAQLARHDGELRIGDAGAALDGYLGLEGAARRAGCLGPLLYRIGLVAAAGTGQGAVDWDLVRRWSALTPASPECGLVRAILPAGTEAEAAPAPETGPPAFSEGAAGEAGSTGPASTPAAGAAVESTGTSAAPPDEAAYAVQLGSYHDRARAQQEADRLAALGLPVRIDIESDAGGSWNKLRLGRSRTREEAEELGRTRCTGLDWQVVRIVP